MLILNKENKKKLEVKLRQEGFFGFLGRIPCTKPAQLQDPTLRSELSET